MFKKGTTMLMLKDVYKRQGMYRDFEAHAREAQCNLLNKEAE